MGRITSFSKQVIAVFLALTLFINPAFSNTVGGSIGGWQVVSNVANGIGAKVTATKEVILNGASKVITGTANVIPNASSTAKFMARVGGVALVVDAMDLVLDGVDYVLDPANNTVTYKKKTDTVNANPWQTHCWSNSGGHGCYSTVDSAANAFCKHHGFGSASVYYNNGSMAYANCAGGNPVTILGGKPNPLYDPSVNESEHTKPITVPLSNIASQVITQAEKDIKAGNPASPAVVLARTVAQAEIAEAEADDSKAPPIVNQLQQSASIPTSQTAEGEITHPPITDPATGEVTPVPPSGISLDFPVFCSWAPTLCVMADSVKEAISDVTAEYTEPVKENTDTKLELSDESQDQNIDIDISFGGSCPASRYVPVSFAGISTEVEFSFQWFCEIASIAKPVIISISAFAAVLIVAGVRTEDD